MPDKRDLHGVDPSEYKNIPGNQTADTPDVDESRRRRDRESGGSESHGRASGGGSHGRQDLRGVDPSEYKNIPGNQTADTPDVDESDR